MRASAGARGMAAATRPAQASAPRTTAPTRPAPVRMPMLAPAPRARIPRGEVVARATGGVKNRSRSDSPLAMSGEGYGLEVADHRHEDLVDRPRIARVVERRLAGFGD